MKNKLKQDLKTAMMAKDTIEKNTLRLVLSAIAEKEKNFKGELTDKDREDIAISCLEKELKDTQVQLAAVIDIPERVNLVTEYQTKIKILENYLPKKMTKSEIGFSIGEIIIENNINELSNKTRGAIIGAFMKKHEKSADGKLVNECLNRLINGD